MVDAHYRHLAAIKPVLPVCVDVQFYTELLPSDVRDAASAERSQPRAQRQAPGAHARALAQSRPQELQPGVGITQPRPARLACVDTVS